MEVIKRGVYATIMLLTVVGIVWRLPLNGWASLGWLLTALAVSIIRAPYAKRSAQNTITASTASATDQVLLVLVMLGGTLLPLTHLLTGWFEPFNYVLPGWAPLLGLVVLVPSLWLFWRSHDDLGRNWSVTTEIREGHDLVTRGVYARVRHPMYSAIWLFCATQPLFVQNWIAGLAGPLSFAILYVIRVPYEEAMMRERFGSAYDAYASRTGRLLPRA